VIEIAMDKDRLIRTITKHEGKKLFPYIDSENILTIGVGHNLEAKGISEAVCAMMLDEDLSDSIKDAKTFWWFDLLDSVRQEVVVNMIFNLGLSRFRGFTRTINAIENNQWERAAAEMLDSKWARQVGRRASELATAMRVGII
jgi:lysozyme